MLLYQSTPSGVKALSKLALTQYKRLSNNGHWPPSPTVPRKQADTHPSAFHAVAFPAAFQALSDEIQLICKDILVEHTMVLVTTLKPSVTSAAKVVTSVPTVQISPRVPKLTHGKKPHLSPVALKPSLGMAEKWFWCSKWLLVHHTLFQYAQKRCSSPHSNCTSPCHSHSSCQSSSN